MSYRHIALLFGRRCGHRLCLWTIGYDEQALRVINIRLNLIYVSILTLGIIMINIFIESLTTNLVVNGLENTAMHPLEANFVDIIKANGLYRLLRLSKHEVNLLLIFFWFSSQLFFKMFKRKFDYIGIFIIRRE